jgi:acyl-CoA thioester hydrolase
MGTRNVSEPGEGTVVTYRGVVYPAQCDAMGHMNVQHIVAAFDQAIWHLVHELGYRSSWVTERHRGWADVRYLINYHRELRAGELFYVTSGVVRVGNSSLVTLHQVRQAESGEIAADTETTSVYFDLTARKSVSLPADIKAAAQSLLAVGDRQG